MGAKERKTTDTVLAVTSDEKVVALLTRISCQLESMNGLLRHMGSLPSVNAGTVHLPSGACQDKSDVCEKISPQQVVRDEIPKIDGVVISGFGDDV